MNRASGLQLNSTKPTTSLAISWSSYLLFQRYLHAQLLANDFSRLGTHSRCNNTLDGHPLDLLTLTWRNDGGLASAHSGLVPLLTGCSLLAITGVASSIYPRCWLDKSCIDEPTNLLV